MSEVYGLELGFMEPCQNCGRGKSTPLRLIRQRDGSETMAVLCDHCYDARIAAIKAVREQELLADWGTIGQRRTA